MNQENKLSIFLITIAYIGVLIWGYQSYLVPIWGYFNLESKPSVSIPDIFFIYIFALVPLLFLKFKINRPSFFSQWILYFMLYIPMLLGVWLDPRFSSDVFYISSSYLLSFYLQNIFNNKKRINFGVKKIPSKYFWTVFIAIVGILTIYVVFAYRNNFSFANILSSEEVYDLRESGGEIESSYLMIGYIIMLLAGAGFPLLLIRGLVEKKKVYVTMGIVGLIMLYMTMAHKGYLVSIFYIYGIYKLLSMKRMNKIYTLLTVLTSLCFIMVFFQSDLNPIPIMFDVTFGFAALFLFRTVYNGTMMSIYYNKFFESHPHTYFSHISGINQIIQYPYDKSLGSTVGAELSGFENLNANASYILTDGLSAIGYPGIWVAGFILGFIFYIFDCASLKHDKRMTTTVLALVTTTLINVSLFTTLISGGLLLLIILFLYMENSSKLSVKKM